MRRAGLTLLAIAFGVLIGFFLANRWSVRGQGRPGAGFASVPGEVGGWDLTGPYDVAKDWPKPLSQLPGHEKWRSEERRVGKECRCRWGAEEEDEKGKL